MDHHNNECTYQLLFHVCIDTGLVGEAVIQGMWVHSLAVSCPLSYVGDHWMQLLALLLVLRARTALFHYLVH